MANKYLDISPDTGETKTDAGSPPADESVSWVDHGWYLALEFELTSSAKFDQVVEMAKSHPHFTELVDERGVSLFRTIYFKRDFPKFDALYALVGNWKSTRLYLKGDEITRTDFETWYSCYKTYWGHRKLLNDADACGQTRAAAFPDFLGCYERNILLKWRDPMFSAYQFTSKVWYHFGKRVRDLFVVDKEAMLAYLQKANDEYVVCPCYGHAWIDHFITKLPREINPLITREWLFKEDYLKTQVKTMFNYDIALSTLPAICPVNEKAYVKFMNRMFSEEEE